MPVLARLHGKEILGDKKLAEYNRLNQQLVTLEQQKIEVKEEFAMAVAERGRQKTLGVGTRQSTIAGRGSEPFIPQILGILRLIFPRGTGTAIKPPVNAACSPSGLPVRRIP